MPRFAFLSAAVLLASVASPAQAAVFTTWNPISSTTRTATGTIADVNGSVDVELTISNASNVDYFFGVRNSSTFGTFSGGLTVADVYEPNPPGTSDFLGGLAGSNGALYTLNFSKAVVNPVFHVYNNDFRNYNFLGGLTPTVISGLNLAANGSSVGDVDGGVGSNFDNGGLTDPNKGRPGGSAYGSFQLTGTFTSISWNRTLNPGAFVTDGYSLGVSVDAVEKTSVPEPGSLALLGGVAVLGAGSVFKRKLSQEKV
ncbi:MAG TPA: PEP-CTERM sorting domain-containing protein [Nostocaceae cyanobacterium]|nr:PEP-CTERM sorting domain-containing protein [Nostocaceae cyanobacterium]